MGSARPHQGGIEMSLHDDTLFVFLTYKTSKYADKKIDTPNNKNNTAKR